MDLETLLQQFLGYYSWDERRMAQKVRHIVRDEHGCAEGIGVIDETGIAKKEVGLDHFEVRGYRSVKRHHIVSMASLLFLQKVSRRLRGEKGGALDLCSGPGGDRRTA